MLSLIYARAENYCIGRAGDLPWDLPDEMQYFEDTTRHSTVIMGRRTFEDHETVLPERRNLVVSKTRQRFPAGIEVYADFDAALRSARDENIFVIGGVSLFDAAFPLADVVHETIVDCLPDGDTFVSAYDFSAWHTRMVLTHPADAHHGCAFSILVHQRIGPVSPA